MTTVVNNPAPSNDSGNNMGMIVGLVVILVLGYLFIMYGIPALSQMKTGGTQITVPSKIDVNVKQPAK
jgi:multidrug efflux pump subunit AcrA (membrane-fusion protein)